MPAFLNTEDLITSIKTRTLAPTSQSTFSDTNIIQFINEEMQLTLVTDMMSIREDFFLKIKAVPLINLVEAYSVPQRAIGNVLKDIFYLDSSGNRRPLTRTSTRNRFSSSTGTQEPQFYFIEADQIIIDPPLQNPSGSLEFYYYQRPSEIVPTASVAKITAVSSLAGITTFTVDTDLTASLSSGSLVDVLSAKSPFQLWGQDTAITTITSTTIAVASSAVSDENSNVLPVVNDYVCPQLKANIPMVPQELHPVLAQMVAQRLIEALGDERKLTQINAKLQDMRRQVLTLLSNRVEDSPERVLNRNSLLASSGLGWPARFFVR